MSDDLPPSRADSRGSSASPVSTWTNWPEQPAYVDPKTLNAQLQVRPHTVSVPSHKHQRPPLSDQTFEPPVTSAAQCHYATSESACVTIAEDSFEKALQSCLSTDESYCSPCHVTKVAGNPEEFPAPPPDEVLQRISSECCQMNASLGGLEAVDLLPPPPPPDYADVQPQPTQTRTLANESSPISKLIRQLSYRNQTAEPNEYAETAVSRNASRPRPAPPQRRSSIQPGVIQMRQNSASNFLRTRDRTSFSQTASNALPLAAQTRVSVGGIAACPAELTDRAGAILRQIKTGVSLRRCASTINSETSRPLV